LTEKGSKSFLTEIFLGHTLAIDFSRNFEIEKMIISFEVWFINDTVYDINRPYLENT